MFDRSMLQPTVPGARIILPAFWIFMLGFALIARAEVVSYPAPEGEALSTDYTILADGKPVPVYLAKTQHHDKKPYSFACFDFSGSVTVTIKTKLPLDALAILPAKYGISAAVTQDQASFTTDKPFDISFEPTGQNIPLHLFASPIEKDAPRDGDPNVVYFGPGIHKPEGGLIKLTAGQTLYIAGGAIVKAGIASTGDNIRIMGRGILDGNDWPHAKGPADRMVWLKDGHNIIIQDIIVRGAWNWTVVPTRCEQVLVSNIRICGSRCGNDDGIDPCNSRNVLIKSCFVHTDDDGIAIKGTALGSEDPKPSENIVVEDCTFWIDFANGFRIGAESRATGCRNITARNIDFIHFPNRSRVAVFYLHPRDNMPMENLFFENIRINGEQPLNLIRLIPMGPDDPGAAPATKPTTRPRRRREIPVLGNGPYIHNVVFKDIAVSGHDQPGALVYLEGLSDAHNVSGITLDNVIRYGVPLSADRHDVQIGRFVSNVQFIAPPPYKASDIVPASQPTVAPASNPAATQPVAPPELPGRGLLQHDFLYAGEGRSHDIVIIRKGKVDWTYHHEASRGEISDATLLPNGNVLFAHGFGVMLIDPQKKVLWNFDAPPNTEIHTAQAIGNERVLFIINGPEPKMLVVNITTGKTEKELPLPVNNPKSAHGQFRHARLTPAGTLLVAHVDLGKIAEYDDTGQEIWSAPARGCWAAERLANGNTLITCNHVVREVNPACETVWQFTPADVPEYKVAQFQIATRLVNGNTLVNNWVNQGPAKIDPATAPVQAWEITPDKKVVWALRSWVDPNLGPATTIQLLDQPAPSQRVHFGRIE